MFYQNICLYCIFTKVVSFPTIVAKYWAFMNVHLCLFLKGFNCLINYINLS